MPVSDGTVGHGALTDCEPTHMHTRTPAYASTPTRLHNACKHTRVFEYVAASSQESPSLLLLVPSAVEMLREPSLPRGGHGARRSGFAVYGGEAGALHTEPALSHGCARSLTAC